MILQGVQTVLIHVRDVDRARRFYQLVFALPQVHESQGVIGLQAGSSRLLIHPLRPGADHPDGADLGNAPAVYWNVDDVNAVVEAARAAGGVIAEAARDEPWGERDACILDPDGYRVYVTQSGPNSWLNEGIAPPSDDQAAP